MRNPKCPSVFIQEFYSNIHAIDTSISHFTMIFKGTSIIVSSELISEALHVPRVVRLTYPSHPHLHSIFRDELAIHFCEMAMVWGGLQNFTTHDFAKGPRILNMVMTFVLTPRFHYNTITEARAHFLVSLLEGLSIDFPSHMIVSMIHINQDKLHNKLIFLSAVTCILTHLHIPIPSTSLVSCICVISKESIQRSDAQVATKRPRMEPTPAQ